MNVRRISVASVAAVFVLALSACAGATPNDVPSASPSAPVIDDRPLEVQLGDAARAKDVALVTALLDAGANVDADQGAGLTALFVVIANDSPEIVSLLIANGAGLEVRNNVGETPLLYAAAKGSPAVVKLLLDAGADLTAISGDAFGSNALHNAARAGQVDNAVVLLDAGIDVNGLLPDFGATPLETAAYWSSVEMCELLVEYGADVNYRDPGGETALSLALQQQNAPVVAFLKGIGATS